MGQVFYFGDHVLTLEDFEDFLLTRFDSLHELFRGYKSKKMGARMLAKKYGMEGLAVSDITPEVLDELAQRIMGHPGHPIKTFDDTGKIGPGRQRANAVIDVLNQTQKPKVDVLSDEDKGYENYGSW